MENQQTLTLKNNKDVELNPKILDHSQRWNVTEGSGENKGYYRFKSLNSEGKEDGKVLALNSNEKPVKEKSSGKGWYSSLGLCYLKSEQK